MPDVATYDFEDRTYKFALKVRSLIYSNKWQRHQWTDIDQLLRSSGSVGANYIEANDSLSTKDFQYRIRIRKKEAKESRYWIRLLGGLITEDNDIKKQLRELYQESDELMRILATMLKNNQTKEQVSS